MSSGKFYVRMRNNYGFKKRFNIMDRCSSFQSKTPNMYEITNISNNINIKIYKSIMEKISE